LGSRRKPSFSEEKEAKKLLSLRPHEDRGLGRKSRGSPQDIKVFWFFSSEKNFLPYGAS
jgi:hypothetical protein